MQIRNMDPNDTEKIVEMMRVFYASPLVHTDGSDAIFKTDVENCINGNSYLEGVVFEEDNRLMGYAMLAKSFSTEFGKPCVWIEDLYIDEPYRGQGLGNAFLKYVEDTYPNAVVRLEVEEENRNAVHVYRKAGFEVLPYMEMYKIQD